MPPPSCSPWSPAGLAWGSPTPPPLVHFTAHTPPVPHNTVMHCKRKPCDLEPVIPAKQFITEEKMAAHLSGMHISHKYREHGEAAAAPGGARPPHEWLRGAHTIVLADEIKRLQREPLIPPTLLERLEKPCTSLMVWQPRETIAPRDEDEEEEGMQGARGGGAPAAEHPPVSEHPPLDTDVEM